jgi:site-specific recombinase XerD
MQHNPVTRVSLPKVPERLPSVIPESKLKLLWSSMSATESDEGYPALRDRTLLSLLSG